MEKEAKAKIKINKLIEKTNDIVIIANYKF